jgi:hypothetical protein
MLDAEFDCSGPGELRFPGSGNYVGRTIKGTGGANTLQFHTVDEDIPGYVFATDLHRGTRADYNALQK